MENGRNDEFHGDGYAVLAGFAPGSQVSLCVVCVVGHVPRPREIEVSIELQARGGQEPVAWCEGSYRRHLPCVAPHTNRELTTTEGEQTFGQLNAAWTF